MVERERSGYSSRTTTHSIDEAIREGWDIAVKYTDPDGNNCTIRGLSASYDKKYIKVFDNSLDKWIFIPIEKIRRIGTCKPTGKIEEDLSYSSSSRSDRSHSNKPRRRSRKPFSYRRWWKDDTVQEDIDTKY